MLAGIERHALADEVLAIAVARAEMGERQHRVGPLGVQRAARDVGEPAIGQRLARLQDEIASFEDFVIRHPRLSRSLRAL